MGSRISHTTINCTDAFTLCSWWKVVLGYEDIPGDPNEQGDEQCMIAGPAAGHRLLFIEVNELQVPDGRVHLDLTPSDRSRDDEIARLLALGATEVAEHRQPDGTGWLILADPEGNRFCVLRSDDERSGSTTS